MEFGDLLQRYFGTRDVASLSPGAQEAGVDRLLVDFGLEEDRGRKFALWSLLFVLGRSPDLDVAFEDEADREAARNLADLLSAGGDED